MTTLTTDQGGEPPAAQGRRPIVGRGPELEELLGALNGAVAGRGALLLITGEAGIGKTRLVETLAEAATARGCGVLWGAAWDAGGAPAYWPWTQAVRELLSQRPAAELTEDLGTGAPYVAQIAPDVARLFTAIEPAPTIDSDAARFTAFDALVSFLRAAAARRPIVIVLDDLHAADVATVRLLEFLALSLERSPILALATCRSEPAGGNSEVASALAGIEKATHVTLAGLSREDVQRLVARHAHGTPPSMLVERLHRLTGGNPLFVDEILRLLGPEGAAGAATALLLPVPRAVREAIRRRLAPLPPEVVETLRTAAVIGPEFALETLARTCGEDRRAVLSRLDAAAVAGLVRELPNEIGRYAFHHALVRETLYDDLPTPERMAYHAAVGEALVAIYGEAADAPLSVLAYHFLQAAPAGDAMRAVDLAERAGHQALRSMAYEHAIDLFADALSALEDHPCGPQRRGTLLLAMGQAEIGAGWLDQGRTTLRDAAEVARAAGDAELLARAALASAPWGLATATSDEAGLIPFLREALDGLPQGDGALRARVIARLAAALYWTEEADQRRALSNEAIDIARRVGDPATLAFVLSDAHRATWDPDSPRLALEWVDEASALAERVGNVELALAARSWRISLLLELGELAAVDREIEAFAVAATQLHQRRARTQSLVHRCARALIAGRFADGEQLFAQACEDSTLLEQDAILAMRVRALAFVMREAQGRLAELAPFVRAFAESETAMPVWRCGLLCVLLQSGDADELRLEYDRFAARDFRTVPRDNLWLPSLALLSEACTHLGDAAGARTLRTMLEPYAGRTVVTPDVAYIGPVDRYLALLAETEGDREAAATWVRSAKTLAQSMGARATCARLALDEARMLAAGDPARAAELTAVAAAEADALGLAVVGEGARALAEELAAARPAPPVTVRAAEPPRLRRAGDVWEIGTPGATFYLKDTLGVRLLARLLADPDQDVHVLELVAAQPGPAVPLQAVDDALTVGLGGQGDLGPVLDQQAKAAYLRSARELEEELEEAERFHDVERASRKRAELDALTHAMAEALGRGGRDRRPGSHAERARMSVTKALGTVIKRVHNEDPALGHHLETCVHRGMRCRYAPGPGAPRWDVEGP